MNGMVRKCKRFLVLALTALLVCNEIVVVEASGSGQAAVVEEVQQENATEATSLTSQEEDLDETGEGEVKEEVTTEVQEDGAEEVTQSEEVKSEEAESETKTEAATEDETELVTKEEVTEDNTETETTIEETTVEETTEELTTEELTTEELTTEEFTEIDENEVALAMAIAEGENYATYAIADLEQVVVWGAEVVENEDGSVHFTFPGQYDQLTFRIPEEVDKSRLEKIIFLHKIKPLWNVNFVMGQLKSQQKAYISASNVAKKIMTIMRL